MAKGEKKYVWLNLETGEFSNSWDEKSHNDLNPLDYGQGGDGSLWKCIEYTCLNDSEFEFMNKMKLR